MRRGATLPKQKKNEIISVWKKQPIENVGWGKGWEIETWYREFRGEREGNASHLELIKSSKSKQ